MGNEHSAVQRGHSMKDVEQDSQRSTEKTISHDTHGGDSLSVGFSNASKTAFPTDNLEQQPISPPPRKRRLDAAEDNGPRKRHGGFSGLPSTPATREVQERHSMSPANVRHRFVRDEHARRQSPEKHPRDRLHSFSGQTPRSPVSVRRPVEIVKDHASLETPRSPEESPMSTTSRRRIEHSPPRSSAPTFNYKGVRDVPTGPRGHLTSLYDSFTGQRLSRLQKATRLPHIIIDYRDLPRRIRDLPRHLYGLLKNNRPDDIVEGDRGWYLVFEDTDMGRERLHDCFKWYDREQLFRKHTLHMECHAEGEGEDLQRKVPKPKSAGSGDIPNTLETPNQKERSVPATTMRSNGDGSKRMISDQGHDNVNVEHARSTSRASAYGAENKLVPPSNDHTNAVPPIQIPNARLLGRSDKDDASSSISGATPSDTSRSKRSRCHKCKQEAAPGSSGLVRCSTCPRKYHRRCHDNPSIPPNLPADHTWTCSRCTKKESKRLSETNISEQSIMSDHVDESNSLGKADPHSQHCDGNNDKLLETRSDIPANRISSDPSNSRGPQTSLPDAGSTAIRTDLEPDRVPSEIDADEVVKQSFAQSFSKPAMQELEPKPGKLKFTRKKVTKPTSVSEPVLHKDHVALGDEAPITEEPAAVEKLVYQGSRSESALPTAADIRLLAANSQKTTKSSTTLPSNGRGVANDNPIAAGPSTDQNNCQIPESRAGEDEDSASMSIDTPAESSFSPSVREAALKAVTDVEPNPSSLTAVQSKSPPSDMLPPASKQYSAELTTEQASRDPRSLVKKLGSFPRESRRRIDSSPPPERSDFLATPLNSDRPRPGPKKVRMGSASTTCTRCKTRKIVRDPSGINTLCTQCKGELLAAKKPRGDEATSKPGQGQGLTTHTSRLATTSRSSEGQTSASPQTLDGTRSPNNRKSPITASVQPQDASQHVARFGQTKQSPAVDIVQDSDQSRKPAQTEQSSNVRRIAKEGSQPDRRLAKPQVEQGESDSSTRNSIGGDISMSGDGYDGAADASPVAKAKQDKDAIQPSIHAGANETPPSPKGFDLQASGSSDSLDPAGFSVEQERKLREQLGDSHERPKGSRAQLVGMAMCAAPQYRLQANTMTEWVANNIPTYVIGEGKWEDSLKAQLSQGREGAANGTRKFRWQAVSWQPGDAGDPDHQSYQLLPGAAEFMWQWDAVLKEPSPPQRLDSAKPKATRRVKTPSKLGQALAQESQSGEARAAEADIQRLNRKTANSLPRSIANEAAQEPRHERREDTAINNYAAIDANNAMDIDPVVGANSAQLAPMNEVKAPIDAAGSGAAQQSSDDEPIAHKRHKATHDPTNLTPAPVAIMQPTPSVTEADDQSDGQQLMHGTSNSPGDVEVPNGARSKHLKSPHKSALYNLPFRKDIDSISLREAVREEAPAIDCSALSLFDEWPEYNPWNDVDKAAKIAQIRQRPTRKEVFGKPASRSRLYQPQTISPYSSFESPTKKTTISPEKRSRAIIDARPSDPYPWEDPDADFSHQEFETLDEFFGLPGNPIPILSEGQLAFRDGTRNEDGRLPRAKAVYKTGYAA